VKFELPILPPRPPSARNGNRTRVHARAKWEPRPVVVRPSTPIEEPVLIDHEYDRLVAGLVREMQDHYCQYEAIKARLADLQGKHANPDTKQLVFPFAVKMIVVD
jgi:hypothetical protein